MIYFKNVSSDDLSLVVKNHGRRQRAKEKIEIIDIPGRNGSYVEHTGIYESYQRPMTMYLMDLSRQEEVFDLFRGYGELQTSYDEGVFFKAHVVSMVDNVEASVSGINELGVTFEINPPFAYHENGKYLITLTNAGTIINGGTCDSEPYYKIYGTGNGDLQINGKFISLTGIQSYIEIDMESKEIYKDTLNQGKKLAGKLDDLKLMPGENTLSWTGGITKIEIIPRWRDY